MKKELTQEVKLELLETLQKRFEMNMNRHKGIEWEEVLAKLVGQPAKLWTLNEMEMSGGEPDVLGDATKKGEYSYYDCSKETPIGRRNLCYDRAALNFRKANKPSGSAMDLAREMGIEILDEAQYRYLQSFGEFDTKTSSWLMTPDPIRKLGGAIFGDFWYGGVFVYHNGAESYYGVRGFRGVLVV